jgi:hypothetical protein
MAFAFDETANSHGITIPFRCIKKSAKAAFDAAPLP